MKQDQKAFNIMVKHLLKQGCRSIEVEDDRAACLYRGPNGTKCAVGVLISDEVWDDSMEYHAIVEEKLQHALKESGWTGLDKDLLRSVQRVHDFKVVESWENQLSMVAFEYGLTMPELC